MLKSFFRFTGVVSVVLLSGCNIFAGDESLYGYPYGYKANCDAKLPIEDLRKCVEEKYAFMDKIYMTPQLKYETEKKEKYTEDKYDNFPDTHKVTWKEVPEFKSIKGCYERNKCYISTVTDSLAYDNYKRLISVERGGSIDGFISEQKCSQANKFGEERAVLDCTSFSSFSLTTIPYRHFLRSYQSLRKDLVNFYDGGLNVYTAGIEVVRINGGKSLLAIRILEFIPLNPERDGYKLNGTSYYSKSRGVFISKESVKNRLSLSKGFTVWDIRDDDIKEMSDNLAISLDKREYPTKIYINTGKKVYEVEIPTDKDKIK